MIKKFFMFSALAVLVGAGCVNQSQITEDEAMERDTAPISDAQSGELTVPTDSIPNEKKLMDKTFAFPGVLDEQKIKDRQIRIETPKGEIIFELFEDEAPKTVSNFVYLTREGFYDGLTFHRVEPGFVIQGGDPNGNGTGGPGYTFEDEPVTRAYEEGIVAMANRGPDTNGSQFFVMLENTPLPPAYTIFGKVTKGMDVVKQIAIGDVMNSVIVEAKN